MASWRLPAATTATAPTATANTTLDTERRLRFGEFELDVPTRTLTRLGQPLRIGSRAFDLLLTLVVNADRIVSAKELRRAAWPDTEVNDNNLRVHLSSLRKLLGEDAIVTVPRRGWQLARGAAPDNASPALARVPPLAGNLPPAPPLLVGRTALLQRLQTLLAGDHRPVALVGPAGAGKSALALAAAHAAAGHYDDGVWWVELSALSHAAHVLAAVVRTLSLQFHGVCTRTELARALQGRRLLLVLDGCDQHLGAVASIVDSLKDDAPGVVVLLTSRLGARLADEETLHVGPLDLPGAGSGGDDRRSGALNLLLQQARALDATFTLRADALPAARQVCHVLQGLPLALRLAAARLPAMGSAALLDSLGARPLNSHGSVAWAYRLLDGGAQAAFAAIGVFGGSFSLQALQDVAAAAGVDPAVTRAHVDTLLQRHLLEPAGDGAAAAAADGPRFSLHDSVRSLARERLQDRPDADRCHAALALHLLARLRNVTDLGAIEPDIDNLRQAIDWTLDQDIDLALKLCAASATFWRTLQQTSELAAYATTLMTSTRAPREQGARAECLLALAAIELELQREQPALQHVEEARALLGPDDAPPLAGLAMAWKGALTAMRGQYADALACCLRSRELLRGSECLADEARALGNLAWVLRTQGRMREAANCMEDSVKRWTRLGRDAALGAACAYLGELQFTARHFDAAHHAFAEALGLARVCGDAPTAARCLVLQGLCWVRLHKPVRARGCLHECLQLMLGQALPESQADAYTVLAGALLLEGKHETALLLLHAAEKLRLRWQQPLLALMAQEHQRLLTLVLREVSLQASRDVLLAAWHLDVRDALSLAANARPLQQPSVGTGMSIRV